MKDLIKIIILIGLLIIAALQACSDSVAEEVSPAQFATGTTLTDDFYFISEDENLPLNVLQNDKLLPGTTLVLSEPTHGSILLDSAAGGFRYVPEKEFKGKVTFSYRVCAGDFCEHANVEISIL